MAYNAKTFAYHAYPEVIDAWVKADEALADGVSHTFVEIPVPEDRAVTLLHTFNRVRAGWRAQAADQLEGTQYDYIAVKIHKVPKHEGGGTFLRFTSKDAGIPDLQLFDEKGDKL